MLVTHGASSVSHKRQLLNVRATNCRRRTTSKGLGAIRRWALWALWAALLSEPCIVCQALKMACLLWPVGSCRHPNSVRPTKTLVFFRPTPHSSRQVVPSLRRWTSKGNWGWTGTKSHKLSQLQQKTKQTQQRSKTRHKQKTQNKQKPNKQKRARWSAAQFMT